MSRRGVGAMVRAGAVTAIALVAAACTIENQDAPPLAGPSGFALNIVLRATPDTLPRDGASQSEVTVTVRDASGSPKAGQRLTVTVVPSSARTSASEVTTGPAGTATFAVTAPNASDVAPNNVITVFVTAIGDDFGNARSEALTIALAGTSNTTAPAPSFTARPASCPLTTDAAQCANPRVREVITFDASATTDEGSPCASRCTYTWNFGDGTTASGMVVTKSFAGPGNFVVVLSVTDAAGTSAWASRIFNIPPVVPPTATFTVSPAQPIVNQPAAFTASTTVDAGRRIVSYEWNFGDGTSQTISVPSVSKTYSTEGSRTVVLTVTDDLGLTATATLNITVVTGVIPNIRVSPTDPSVGQTVFFDASGTTFPAGVTATSYEWDFGNGSTATTTSPTATTSYPAARTWTVRLTIVDSNGRRTTTFITVTVS